MFTYFPLKTKYEKYRKNTNSVLELNFFPESKNIRLVVISIIYVSNLPC
jgi:hypothetical protein